MAYTPARKERKEGEGPLRAENKEIAPKKQSMHMFIVESWEGENPKTPRLREGENPKTPIIGCAISQVETQTKSKSGNP